MTVRVRERPLVLSTDLVLEAVRESARARGIEAYLVGGFVRDRLLGRAGKDIDLLTVDSDGTPILEDVAARFHWAPPQRFERFGTGQVRGGDVIVEAVRARSESYDPASRRPDVRPGSLADDIWRRDFTVNALCQDLDGHLIDITGRGVDDLLAGILRTPLDPEQTFSEDPLRMFRAARFVAQLGLLPAPGLTTAMAAIAERARILSAERIAEELRRLLLAEQPRQGLDLLRDGGLCAVCLPEMQAMVGVEQGGYHIYDVFDHTAVTVAGVPADLVTRLAALCHDVGKPSTHAIGPGGKHTFYDHPSVGAEIASAMLRRLRFSNEEIEAVATLVRHHLRPIQYQPAEWTDAAVRRLVRDIGPLRDRLVDLARGDTRASSYPDTEGIDELAERMEALDAGGSVSELRPAVGGDELIALAGGRAPGPWIGRIHRALEEAVLEGLLAGGDREGALRWIGGHPDLLGDDHPQRP